MLKAMVDDMLVLSEVCKLNQHQPRPRTRFASCVSPCTAIYLHYIPPQTSESGTSGQPQSAADWPPLFFGLGKEPPLQESKTHQKSQPENAKPKNRVETQIKHA